MRLDQPLPSSRLKFKQTVQELSVRFQDITGSSLLVTVFLSGLSLVLVKTGLNALKTESIWTGAVLIPWLLVPVCLAAAMLFCLSRPIWYVDPPGSAGKVRFQWLIAELVIDRQTLRLRLRSPVRHRWVCIPLSDVLRIERVEQSYSVLLRRVHDRYCCLRTRSQDYVIGPGLRPDEQDWLVAELSAFLQPIQSGDS